MGSGPTRAVLWSLGFAQLLGGVSFSALRVLEWVFTTPVLLLLVQHLHEYAFAELPSK